MPKCVYTVQIRSLFFQISHVEQLQNAKMCESLTSILNDRPRLNRSDLPRDVPREPLVGA